MRRLTFALLMLLCATSVQAQVTVVPTQATNNAGVATVTIKNVDGTVTLPAVTFYEDNDTGIYRISNGKMGVTSNGTLTWTFPTSAPTDTYMVVWDAATQSVKWVPNAVTVSGGGTGVSTFGGANTLLYTSAADTLTSLANGSTGQALFATTAGAPSWSSNVARLSANTFTADQAMGGFKITGLGAPSDPNDAVRKSYVDATSSGFTVHQEVRVATVADITLANLQTIGGVSLVATNRVLVKDQTLPKENGCYVVVDGGAWTRCTDFDAVGAGEVALNATFFVTAGTINANSSWVLTTAPATLGDDPLLFSQLSKSEQITASAPLVRTVNNLSLTQSGITGVGTLTSGTLSTGVTVELSNITKSGSLGVANGGTGVTSYTTGDLLYASGATTLSKLANVEGYLLAAGASAPKWVRDKWVAYQGVARCQGTTATSMLNLPAGGTAPSAACVAGTNITRGTLDYLDGGGNHTASYPFYLGDDWDTSGAVLLEIYWISTQTTGDAIWSVQTACSGVGQTTDPAYNAAQTVTTAAQGVASYKNKSTIASLTVTGCTPGTTMFVKIDRNGATTGDTLSGTASLIALEIQYFRKW